MQLGWWGMEREIGLFKGGGHDPALLPANPTWTPGSRPAPPHSHLWQVLPPAPTMCQMSLGVSWRREWQGEGLGNVMFMCSPSSAPPCCFPPLTPPIAPPPCPLSPATPFPTIHPLGGTPDRVGVWSIGGALSEACLGSAKGRGRYATRAQWGHAHIGHACTHHACGTCGHGHLHTHTHIRHGHIHMCTHRGMDTRE